MVVELLLVTVFLILAGLADAVCDAWRDGKYPLKSLAIKYPEWYEGTRGTAKYPNDGWPWRSDFWHNVKLVRVFAYCCAIGATFGGWFLLLIPVFAFITGKAFYYTYHSF